MRASDFLIEHSDWIKDPYYDSFKEKLLGQMILTIQQEAKKRGITLDFRGHFYDQMLAKRGMSRIEPEMLVRTFARILARGLHLFQGHDEGYQIVYYDPETNLNIPFIKVKKQIYRLPTIVRDTRWLGPEKKVTL
jgi:hypothetical protein